MPHGKYGISMNKIVITGPTGAIGIAFIQNCIEQGIEVLAVCHHNSKRINHIPNHPLIRIIECDLSEYGTLDGMDFNNYDVFYHLAWNGTFGESRNDMDLQIQNIQYTLDAVRLAKRLGCHTFIGAGSQAEYGRVEGMLSSDTSTNPENGYGMAKLCAGFMSRHLCESMEMSHIWTRILSVYGPFDGKDTMVMSSIIKLLNNEQTQFTPGEQLWDYLYSKDAARALLLLGEKGLSGKTYCLGSGDVHPLKEYVNVIFESTKATRKPEIGSIPYSPKQVMYLGADIRELQKDTGFSPEYSFERGINETVSWYRDTRGKL